MKAILFGSDGQDGFYLQQLLQSRQIDVLGIPKPIDGSVSGDIADFRFVEELVRKEKPDYLFHLAAISSTRHDLIFENHHTIATGTLNVLEAVKRHQPECKVFITGSGVQFENRGLPIKETDTLCASSPYSIARIQSLYAARYFRSLGIAAYVGHLFHHESPFRGDNHVSKMIINAVKRIAAGSPEKIKIGDFSVKKEWGFAGDIVNGMWTLVNQDQVFEAVIGTGKAYSIADWLQTCFTLIGKEWQQHVEADESFTQAEYQLLVSDPSTIFGLGWKPEVGFADLAALMLKNA